jgi:hypothetical protein
MTKRSSGGPIYNFWKVGRGIFGNIFEGPEKVTRGGGVNVSQSKFLEET